MNWNRTQLLAILPQGLRQEHFDDAREIRLRLGQRPRLVTGRGFRDLDGTVGEADLKFVVNAASRFSPWNAESMKDGYLTAPGGHRIGLCGDGAALTSLCIRVARDVRGVASGLPMDGSLLILGPPGTGKTTLLREYIRVLSEKWSVSVATSS